MFLIYLQCLLALLTAVGLVTFKHQTYQQSQNCARITRHIAQLDESIAVLESEYVRHEHKVHDQVRQLPDYHPATGRDFLI